MSRTFYLLPNFYISKHHSDHYKSIFLQSCRSNLFLVDHSCRANNAGICNDRYYTCHIDYLRSLPHTDIFQWSGRTVQTQILCGDNRNIGNLCNYHKTRFLVDISHRRVLGSKVGKYSVRCLGHKYALVGHTESILKISEKIY